MTAAGKAYQAHLRAQCPMWLVFLGTVLVAGSMLLLAVLLALM